MNVLGISSSDVRTTSTSQSQDFGAKAESIDGRAWRYASVGSGGLSAGQLGVAEAVASNHTNRTLATGSAVGTNSVAVPLGATAATADQYAQGFLVVNDGTGEGNVYRISGHAAAASSGTLTVNLSEPLTVALTNASDVSLVKNPWKDIVASTTIARAAGVANVAIAASSYGWVQTRGVCSVLADGTPAKGNALIQSDGTAGAVEVGAAHTDQVVGYALETFVSTENRAAYLQID